ncbi:MAG: hypothetical protein ACXVMS_13075 [Flavisolibacter sp.]
MTSASTQNMGRGRSSVKKFLWIFFILLLLFAGGYLYWKYYFTYSSGNRYGLLQKFSHKGNLFKTYEGEMILSSIKSNMNVALASEKFLFSVTDRRVADELMNAQGKFVTVHYQQKNAVLSWRGETPYIVDSVKVEP